MNVEISVIVPTYRRPQLLKRCLDALLTQHIDVPYEVIVVVDGPSEDVDLTCHISSPRLDDVHIVTVGRNCGPATARNFGFAQAKGNLIVFTDDDCIPHDNFLFAYWNTYLNTKSRFVAFTGNVFVPLTGDPTDYEMNIKQLETAEFVTANCAMTRDTFMLVDGFDETYTMAWREDSDLQFKLLEQNVPIVRAPDAIVKHPVRKAKWNVSLKSERKNMFNALLYKKFPTYYSSKINCKPPRSYYVMTTLLPIGLGMLLISRPVGSVLLAIWAAFVIAFTLSRLRRSSRQPSHVVAMAVTSIAIPFLSVYWNIYGNIKFRSKLL